MKNLLKILKNFYFIAILSFTTWICFFDTNNIWNQITLYKKHHEFQLEKGYYIREVKFLNERLEKLNDDYYLEKLAREKYHFKKKGEDVYLIVKNGNTSK